MPRSRPPTSGNLVLVDDADRRRGRHGHATHRDVPAAPAPQIALDARPRAARHRVERLLPRAGGRGRVPAVEVLVVNGLVAEALADSEGASKLERIMADGEYYGMQTFDQSLLKLYQRGLVDRATVLAHATYAPSLQVDIERIERTRAGADRRLAAHAVAGRLRPAAGLRDVDQPRGAPSGDNGDSASRQFPPPPPLTPIR